MELTPTEAKRRCIDTDSTKQIQLVECVREFRLPQQFPSMICPRKGSVISWRDEDPIDTIRPRMQILTSPKFVKLVPNKTNHQVKCNLQKLRIVSPTGRDLGEFDMKLWTNQENLLKRKITTVKHVIEPTRMSLSPEPIKIIPQMFDPIHTKENNDEGIKLNLTNALVNDKSIFQSNKINISPLQKLKTSINKINKNTEVNKEMQISKNDSNKIYIGIPTCKSDFKKNIKKTNDEKCIELEHKSPVKNNESLIDKSNNTLSRTKVATSLENDIYAYNMTNKELSIETKWKHKNIAESQFSIINCNKLEANSGDNKYTDTEHIPESPEKLSNTPKKKCYVVIQTKGNGKVITSLKKIPSDMKNCNKIENITTKIKKEIDSDSTESQQIVSVGEHDRFQTTSDLVHQNSEVCEKVTQANILATILSNNNSSSVFNKKVTCTQKYNVSSTNNGDTTVLEYSKDTAHNSSTQSENIFNEETKSNDKNNYTHYVVKSEKIVDDIDINMQSTTQTKDESIENITDVDLNEDCTKYQAHRNLSDQWSIIEKAMSSIKDEDLRIQALKALADCGIGAEKHIPIRPPENFKAVHDSQIQTAVFGLFDPKYFILMDKDSDSIQRIQQISYSDSLLKDYSYPDNNVNNFNTPNILESEIDFDIEHFFNQICNENLNARKVKEVLSMTNIRCKKIIEQLQKDFESVKQYDKDGMLHIHRAVIKNNAFDTRRHVMILKHCKESVDILTKNEMTSLELAIKYATSREIIDILLKAGAQPILPRLVHESAVIIASKNFSSMLQILLDHVTDTKLLNQADSEGFTALHYCCIYGNLNGADALISAGANINLTDKRSGRTPLYHALDNNHKAIAQRLINLKAIVQTANFAGHTSTSAINDTRTRSSKLISKKKRK